MNQLVSLTTPLRWIESMLEKFLTGKYWEVKLLFLALLISAGFLLAFNFILVDFGLRMLYREMRAPGSIGGFFWDDIIRQSVDPFGIKEYQTGTHEANRSFRLTVPLVIKILNLNIATLYFTHVAAGLIFLRIIIRLVYNILQDRITTFYFLVGFTSIYVGANFYINYMGHADAFAYCFMALMFYFRSPFLLLVFSQLAFWCDERAIINSSYIGLWYLLPWIKNMVKNQKFSFGNIPVQVLVLLVSSIVYVIGRQWLINTYNLSVNIGDVQRNALWTLSIIGDKFTRGLEGFWLIIFAGFIVLFMKKDWWGMSTIGICLLITCFGSMIVADSTRALSFGFPVFFFMLDAIKVNIPAKELKYLLIVSTIVSMMLPLSFP